jgi:AraC family transcriptional regulator
MNFYVGVINEAVDYIEGNIGEKLSLGVLSQRFRISDFHFNRMFKTVAGITMKQYILGRKLTKALALLSETNQSVIGIAMDLGFEYPEVFSRSFKKQFGISPAQYRDRSPVLEGISKVCMIERDIINYRGVLALKGNCMFIDEFSLAGVSTETDVNAEDFKEELKSKTESFILKSSGIDSMINDTFYTVVNCHGDDNGEYTVFCGKKLVKGSSVSDFQERTVPGGWYVSFQYHGDMFEIREAFIDDLYRWIMVKEAELNPNGIGMVNVYNYDYPENNGVCILIPVKKPI